jgi:hypothetical protein
MKEVGRQGGSRALAAMARGQLVLLPGLWPWLSYLRRREEFQWFLMALSVLQEEVCV